MRTWVWAHRFPHSNSCSINTCTALLQSQGLPLNAASRRCHEHVHFLGLWYRLGWVNARFELVELDENWTILWGRNIGSICLDICFSFYTYIIHSSQNPSFYTNWMMNGCVRHKHKYMTVSHSWFMDSHRQGYKHDGSICWNHLVNTFSFNGVLNRACANVQLNFQCLYVDNDRLKEKQ